MKASEKLIAYKGKDCACCGYKYDPEEEGIEGYCCEGCLSESVAEWNRFAGWCDPQASED